MNHEGSKTRRFFVGTGRFLFNAIAIAGSFGLLLILVAGSPFKTDFPPRNLTTIDELIGNLPETYKFAVARQGDDEYVVWIGRASGPIRSGPPVYVFDRQGKLVGFTRDAGDSDDRFVHQWYGIAFKSPAMTPEAVAAYCRRNRVAEAEK